MPSTFKRNIIIGFGVSLLLLLLSSAASFISIRGLLSSTQWVDHTYNVINKLENMNASLIRSESAQRGFLLTNDEEFLETMQRSLDSMDTGLAELNELMRDNEVQQVNIAELRVALNSRIKMLEDGVKMRRQNEAISADFLRRGRSFMLQASTVINRMEKEESRLLSERTETLGKFSSYTPMLIVTAALISLAITMLFYGRIIGDYNRRAKLQEELSQKDIEISNRLAIIRDIADKVAGGNYQIRVDDQGADFLGNIAGSLNKMSASLETSFKNISDREWLQSGLAGLGATMIGEPDVETLSRNIIRSVAEYSGSNAGVIYLFNETSHSLGVAATYAVPAGGKTLSLGEGLAGECARQRKIIELKDLSLENFSVPTLAGDVTPKFLAAIPLFHEHTLKGVIELGSLVPYDDNHREYFEAASSQSGLSIGAAQSRKRLQELLEETQVQSEELQAQHSELENINEELKAQSQKLQVSEEELKVQQEELMQTNIELEERTTLLEEKNQMIEERNQEIQQKAKDLALSTKYKSEFLANMSHELRTPLNSILLLSRLMVENNNENLSRDQIEYAEVIQNSGQSLLSLIDEILDLSKIEAGKMEMDFQHVQVREITNDLRSLFAAVAQDKGIAFDIVIEKNVPETIETDKLRIEQILKNLISNALKFTAKGSVTLSVSSHPKDKSRLVFSVKDTGIGIPAEKQKLIFEAFQQADGSTRREYGGTGLGLSISRELARLLGGRIDLTSEPDKGSDFRLVVPLAKPEIILGASLAHEILQDAMLQQFQAQEPAVGNDTGESASPVLVTQDDTPDKMSEVFHRIENVLKKEPRKVLIIEENPVHAKALSYFLENFNIHPEIKTDINEAREALMNKEPSCVVLDMMGIHTEQSYAALENIKKTPGLEYLPIIVFTGKSLSHMQEGRLKQFVNSIVIKTAHSYQRILDEVSIFLHIAQEKKDAQSNASFRKLGRLTEVLKGKKVLVADDDVRNIFSLSKALEAYGMNIISAIDGREALEQVKQDPSIDIVLMDMMMPEMDGYESMSRIRALPGFSKLPIIAVTAKAMAGDREKCIQSGASDYITKPIDKDQLLSLLRVWLYDRV